MKNLIALLLMIMTISLYSCKTQKEIVYLPGQNITTTNTDTVYVTEIRRDTLIKKEKAEASKTYNLKDVKKGFKDSFKNKDASGSVEEKDGKLNVKCECDSLEIAVQLKDKQINTLKKQLKETSTLHPVQYTPILTKILAWVGGILLVAIVLVLIGKKTKFLK